MERFDGAGLAAARAQHEAEKRKWLQMEFRVLCRSDSNALPDREDRKADNPSTAIVDPLAGNVPTAGRPAA